MTGSFSGWSALPTLLAVCAGSVALGLLLAYLVARLIPLLRDLSIAVIVQFLSTFAVWIAAERLHLSGILTVVVFAIRVARTSGERTPARMRIPTYAVWEVAVFVLNVLAFILVGLQLKPILADLADGKLAGYAVTAAAVCAAVIVVRFVWVAAHEGLARLLAGRRADGAPPAAAFPSPRGAVVIAWSGMRGIVTLAAALALPHDFAHRDLVLFTAFAVVLVTLVVQGMTLRPLIRRLALEDDGAVEREVRLARAETARAAIATLAAPAAGDAMVTLLRRKYEVRLERGDAPADGAAPPADELDGYLAAAMRAQRAERGKLSRLRAEGVIGDDAFHRVEEELDWAEVNVETMAQRR